MFVFIGTRPHSDWLPADVLRDAKGFVLTGRDLMAATAYPRIWKEPREPLPLETSVPGVFAAGDLRASAMNRVASAVGEGSMVVRLRPRVPGADLELRPSQPIHVNFLTYRNPPDGFRQY